MTMLRKCDECGWHYFKGGACQVCAVKKEAKEQRNARRKKV